MKVNVDLGGPWTQIEPKLSDFTLEALGEMKFERMTPVQASVIPQFLKHKDTVVQSITGSGKTLAFVIPILEIIHRRSIKLKEREVGAIIITPTRELAKQIYQVITAFIKKYNEKAVLGINHHLVIGGSLLKSEIEELEKKSVEVLVATPGRLEEIMKLGIVSFKELDVLVFDEADRLLDMGFSQSLTFILSKLPKQRRTGLFSATMNRSVDDLVKMGLRNPVRISVNFDEQSTPKGLQNYYFITTEAEKLKSLVKFMRMNQNDKILVYFSTCSSVDYFYKILSSAFPKMAHLHGKMVQKKRDLVYEYYLSNKTRILLTTDLAARGIDVPDIDWVVQFDPPQDPSVFIHRCGRTARIGRQGKAIVFLLEQEAAYVEFLAIRNVPLVEYEELERDEEIQGIESDFEKFYKLIISDRDIYEKGLVAFVSFIRFYQKHHAHYIFQLKKMDLCQLAKDYLLLHIPKMPEIDVNKGKDFVRPFPDLDTNSIPYKDSKREEKRQKTLLQPKIIKQKAKSEPWSKQKDRKEKKQQRKEKKQRKTEKVDEEDVLENDRDYKELQKEQRKLKKIKMGKLANDESTQSESE